MGYRLKTLLVVALFVSVTVFANAQQDSRYDSGLNLPFNEKAGDVNPQTGNITLGFTDLSLPGRAGHNFSFGRIWSLNKANVYNMTQNAVDYSSTLNSKTIERQNNLGVGWSSTLPYILKDVVLETEVWTLFFGGNAYAIDKGNLNIRTPPRSNLVGYDLLDLQLYADTGIAYEDFDIYTFGSLDTEYGLNDTAVDRSAYVLYLKDNSKYWFREDGKLMMNEDKTGLNKIWYFYEAAPAGSGAVSRLRLVVDSIGRKIRFAYDSYGNLNKLEWDVKSGVKNADGSRSEVTEVRSIEYQYTSTETLPETLARKDGVENYVTSYFLSTSRDPMGNITKYDYSEGVARFSFDQDVSHKENVFLLLTSITDKYTSSDGKYKNKRCFEYAVPTQGMYDKPFYAGYMEYFKISKQYYVNRHGEVSNTTRYYYYDENEAGNKNQYTAVLQTGNIKTTYTYSLSGQANLNHVLVNLLVETTDGFIQLTEYAYAFDRTKSSETVHRNKTFAYREKFWFDSKGNLERHEDKMGLATVYTYDPVYSMPIREYRTLKVNGVDKTYELERKLTSCGQVDSEIIYLENDEGVKRGVKVVGYTYDAYGNVTEQTDALGKTVHTVYDTATHAFPIKIWQNVNIAKWANGLDVHQNWQTDPLPDTTLETVIRSFKVFNSDGSVWIEVDNEGYAIEHYYDRNGVEIETVNPDLNDYREFALFNGEDFDDFYLEYIVPAGSQFLASRTDNPGARMEIDYQQDFIKTYADIDKASGAVKVSGVQKDGLGHTEEELEYGENESVYAVKSMEYDNLGRMIALHDPDKGTTYSQMKIHGKSLKRYDKTWLIVYDDLGRQKLIIYPETVEGRTDTKKISYNDVENSVTTVDPAGKKVYQRSDWNGNVVEMIAYGDGKTASVDIQRYTYRYDALNRKVAFIDPREYTTTYSYDERSLLVEQDYGATGKDRMYYDDKGQLIKKTDRKGNIILFTYDELGRNTKSLHYSSQANLDNGQEDHTVAIEYDNRGNAVRISNQNLIEHYIYDYANRVILLQRALKDTGVQESVNSLLDVVHANAGSDWVGMDWLTDSTANWAANVFADHYLEVGEGRARITGNDSHTLWFTDSTITVTGAGHSYKINRAPSGHYDFSYTYNDAGMVTGMTYPDGSLHSFSYDPVLGRLEQIQEGAEGGSLTDFVSSFSYNKSGVVTRMDYANSTYQTWGFDNRKRIASIRVKNSSGEDIEALNYTLDSSGNITAINDNEYAFDGFNRIIKAKTLYPDAEDKVKTVIHYFGTYSDGAAVDGISYDASADLNEDGRVNGEDYVAASMQEINLIYDNEEFVYDRNGNRIKLVQNGDVYTYIYGERNRLLKIELKKAGSSTAKTFAEYEYDANGNTTKRTIYRQDGTKSIIAFQYDTMNRLVKTTEGTEVSEYFYDNAGNRFIKKDSKGLTLYLRHGQIAVAMDVELLTASATEAGKTNRYVLSGDLLAGRITKTLKTDSTIEVKKYWYHLDHLNSTKCVTDETQAVDVRYVYRAFGEQLSKLGEGDAKYTYGGKELDSQTNLYYFNARYYDATIGRFINVDPIQDGTNWYVYANNNPLSIKDPTGLNNVAVYKDPVKSKQDILHDKLSFNDIRTYARMLASKSDSYKVLNDPVDKASSGLGIISTNVSALGFIKSLFVKDHSGEVLDNLSRALLFDIAGDKDVNGDLKKTEFQIIKETTTQRVYMTNTFTGAQWYNDVETVSYKLFEKKSGTTIDVTGYEGLFDEGYESQNDFDKYLKDNETAETPKTDEVKK